MTTGSPRPPRPAREGSLPPAAGSAVERSAGGVVVRHRGGVPHFLLIRDPYRKWGLPKGHLEPGEEVVETALREVREETGLSELVVGPELGEIQWTFRRGDRRIRKYCRFFLMYSPDGDPEPEREEGITACRWLPPDEAVARVSYANAEGVVRRAGELVRGTRDRADLPWAG